MFSIGEFSSATGIPVRTLRFYHEQGLLVPAAIDPENNYRSYDKHNMEVASAIVALRGLEFSLDEIRDILADCCDDTDVLTHVARQKAALAEKLRHYRDIVEKIDRFIADELQAREESKMHAAKCDIEERELEPILVAGVRMNGRYSDCGQGFATLGKRLGRYISGTPLCLFYDGEYRDGDANFEPCMPVRTAVAADGISVRELPAAFCVSLVHRGPYEKLKNSYARILKYVKDQGYEVELPTREVYHKGPGMIFRGNPKKYVTEIQLPVCKS